MAAYDLTSTYSYIIAILINYIFIAILINSYKVYTYKNRKIDLLVKIQAKTFKMQNKSKTQFFT